MRNYIQLRTTDDPDLFIAVAPIIRNDDELPIFGNSDTTVIEREWPGGGNYWRASTDTFEAIPDIDDDDDSSAESITVTSSTLETDTGKMLARILEELDVKVVST